MDTNQKVLFVNSLADVNEFVTNLCMDGVITLERHSEFLNNLRSMAQAAGMESEYHKAIQDSYEESMDWSVLDV